MTIFIKIHCQVQKIKKNFTYDGCTKIILTQCMWIFWERLIYLYLYLETEMLREEDSFSVFVYIFFTLFLGHSLYLYTSQSVNGWICTNLFVSCGYTINTMTEHPLIHGVKQTRWIILKYDLMVMKESFTIYIIRVLSLCKYCIVSYKLTFEYNV